MKRSRFVLGLGLLAVCLMVACTEAPADDGALDGADDTFMSLGKSDVAGIAEATAEACAVRKLASLGGQAQLDDEVKLNARAAAEIARFRLGPDGLNDTDDDEWFETLSELDGVKYVGPKAFKLLLEYATAHGEWACGTVDVQIAAFNDFHGTLKPPSGSSGRIQVGPDATVNVVDAGGVEFLATHLQGIKERNPNTIVVSAGDIVGAAPLLSAAFHDEPTIESMNLLGLDVSAVGNHEFDEGVAELLRKQGGGCHPDDGCQDGDDFGGAAFTYLAANVIEDSTGETLLPAYTIRRFGSVGIAFIGLPLEGTPLVTTQQGVAGVHFLDEADTVNALIPEIQDKGVDAIVVLIHEGGAQPGLYNECLGLSGPILDILQRLDPAVDVVVTGHTHKNYICNIDGRIVTSGASNGRLLTDIVLTIDEATGDVAQMSADNVIVTRTVAKDAGQTALIAKYDAIVAPIANRVIASILGDLTRVANLAGESTMGDVIADAQLESTQAQGTVAAFMNPGGVRADLVASQISGGEQTGELTFGEAFAVQPFGNSLMLVTVTGAQLDTLLEQQWSISSGAEKANVLAVSRGVTYTWDSSRPIGDRVDPATIRIDATLVEPGATYRIAVNSFIADGGDGFSVLKSATERVPGPLDLDALEAYLVAHAPLSVPALDRITRL